VCEDDSVFLIVLSRALFDVAVSTYWSI
jgi:hypothetical protein